MRASKFVLGLIVSSSILMNSCASLNNTAKGSMIGAGAGAAVGAGVGALIGKGKGAAIGAAVGSVVGAGTGALIGRKMDKQKAELAKIQGAKVESITDANNLQAILVTFDSGILFPTGKSSLNVASQRSLTDFALSLKSNPDTDVTIWGHTDNTGSRSVNDRISLERAKSVASFLKAKGVGSSRLMTEGKAFDLPVASNDTEYGRAQNRRVEIYITANEKMINDAQRGK